MKTHAELLQEITRICNDESSDAKLKMNACSGNHLEVQYHIGRRHAAVDILHKITSIKIHEKD